MASNSFAALIAAAKSLSNVEFFDRGDGVSVNADSLRFLCDNEFALYRARRALEVPCSIPLRYDEMFYDEHLEDLRAIRHLARSLSLACDVAVVDGQRDRAVRIALDLLRLANATRRGGLVTSLLFGSCLAGMGIDHLRRMRSGLDSDTRQMLICELKRIECEQEPLEEILLRDRHWASVVETASRAEFADELESRDSENETQIEREFKGALVAIGRLPESAINAMYRQQDQRITALLRMLSVDLVLRSWRERYGTYPESLDAVAGVSGGMLPVDPWSLQQFRYKTMPDGFQLYSAGPTQIDHGGLLGSWLSVTNGENDLGLDSFDLSGIFRPKETIGSVLRTCVAGLWSRFVASN